MTLFVKAKDLSGTKHTILCDDPKRALDILSDRRATGSEAWVEDPKGNRVDAARLNDMADSSLRRLGSPH